MNFLKVISALTVALFLLVFLNNFTDYFFQNNSALSSIYEDPSKGCYDKYPYPEPIGLDIKGQPLSSTESAQAVTFATPDDPSLKAREKCAQEALANLADQGIVAQQNALIRSSVVFMLLLVVSVILFKTAPFLAGGLLLGGTAYMMYQYMSGSMFPFGMMGWGGYGGSGPPSADVLARSQLVKGGLSGTALILLVLGHLFFFEKNSKKN